MIIKLQKEFEECGSVSIGTDKESDCTLGVGGDLSETLHRERATFGFNETFRPCRPEGKQIDCCLQLDLTSTPP